MYVQCKDLTPFIPHLSHLSCSQCGEEWIDDTTAKSLEKIVNEARKKKAQFEVITLK